MASWTKSQLPTPTNDLDKVANDIDQWGYGLLEGALSEPLLTKTRARLLEQAAAVSDQFITSKDTLVYTRGKIKKCVIFFYKF